MYLNDTITSVDLKICLEKAGVDPALWNGKNGTKTFEDLYTEILKGESKIEIEQNARLNRHVFIVVGHVLAIDPTTNTTFALNETHQVMYDGSIKVRNKTVTGFSEKIHGDETPLQAVVRGAKEELKLDPSDYELKDGIQEHIEHLNSDSYPGLCCTQHIYVVTLLLNTEKFLETKERGFCEREYTKEKNGYIVNHFKWSELEE